MRALKNQASKIVEPAYTYTDFPLRGLSTQSTLQSKEEISESSQIDGLIINGGCIRQAVSLLMSVQKGECFFAPTRGVIRDTTLFHILDDHSKLFLENNIKEDLISQEPRLSRLNVKVSQDPANHACTLDVYLQSDMFGREDISVDLFLDEGASSRVTVRV